MNVAAVATTDAPEPSGYYSQALIAGDMVFVSGQAPFTAEGTLVTGDLEAQMRQCFVNLEAVASAAGTSLERAIRIGVYLQPGTDLSEYNRVYRLLMTTEPAPARTTIFSPFPGFDVEIDAVCAKHA
jgi:2-iminobutanoate/2-iminopropanoate deaminase